MEQAPGAPVEAVSEGREYRLSGDARRTALALLAGVIAIALYALWSLGALIAGGLQGPEWVTALLMLAILGVSPFVAWSLLAEYGARIATDDSGLSYRTVAGVRLTYPWTAVRGVTPVPAALGPLTFGDKARSAGRTAETGVTPPGSAFDTITLEHTQGVPVTGQEVEITSSRDEAQGAAAEGEPAPALRLTVDPAAGPRIANPVLRALHTQAYPCYVPLYPGLVDRPALLAEIARHAPPATP
jgi:hypothetical protein